MTRGRKNRHYKARRSERERAAHYEAFVAYCYRECQCDEAWRPCAGVQYGAFCDELRTGTEDDEWPGDDDDQYGEGDET